MDTFYPSGQNLVTFFDWLSDKICTFVNKPEKTETPLTEEFVFSLQTDPDKFPFLHEDLLDINLSDLESLEIMRLSLPANSNKAGVAFIRDALNAFFSHNGMDIGYNNGGFKDLFAQAFFPHTQETPLENEKPPIGETIGVTF